MLQSSRNRPISTSTVQKRLHESGLHGRITTKKPLLKDTNKKKRLVWTKKHKQYVCDSFRIQCTLNQHGYHSILQRYAIPSGLRSVGLSFVFQQDNDPKHTTRLCKGYLTKGSDGVLHQMTWPPQSPDLNPIEMGSEEWDRRMKEKQPTSAKHM